MLSRSLLTGAALSSLICLLAPAALAKSAAQGATTSNGDQALTVNSPAKGKTPLKGNQSGTGSDTADGAIVQQAAGAEMSNSADPTMLDPNAGYPNYGASAFAGVSPSANTPSGDQTINGNLTVTGNTTVGGTIIQQPTGAQILTSVNTSLLDPNAGNFNSAITTYPGINQPYSSNPDTVAVLGWNVGANGARQDPSKAAMTLRFESEYWQPGQGGPADFEFHLQVDDPNGGIHRPLSFVLPKNGGPGSWAFLQTDIISFGNYNSLQEIKFDFTNNTISFFHNNKLLFATNNVPVAVQLNAAGTSYLSLPYYDADNRLRANAPGVFVGPTPSSGVYPNQFFVVQPTSLAAGGSAFTIYGPPVTGSAYAADMLGSATGAWSDLLYNSNNTSSGANAVMQLQTRPGGGDPFAQFDVAGGAVFDVGVDQNDASKFKISAGAFGTNDRITIDSLGDIGLGTSSPTGVLDVNANHIRIRSSMTPASSSSSCNTGDFGWDSGYLYACTSPNTWERTALSGWTSAATTAALTAPPPSRIAAGPGTGATGASGPPVTGGGGASSVAMGAGSVASDHGTAIGAQTIATGGNSTAIGYGAQATAANSVALGAGSIANQANTISVGAVGSERRITNVAAGVGATDATNLGQVQQLQATTLNTADAYTDTKSAATLSSANSYTDTKAAATLDQANQFTMSQIDALNSVVMEDRHRADAGVASAMAAANIPQAWTPGKTLLGVGVGTRGGEGAFAFGMSHMTNGGQMTVKASVTYDSRDGVAAGAGAGFQF